MYKIKRKILLLLSIGLLLTACGSDNIKTTEEPPVIESENKDSDSKKKDKKEDKKKKSNKKSDEKGLLDDKIHIKKDGIYEAKLVSEDNYDKNLDESQITNVNIWDVFTFVSGSLSYKELEDSDVEKLDYDKYVFDNTNNTNYLTINEDGSLNYGYDYYEEYNQFYKDNKDSGLTMTIEVENGYVQSVVIHNN